MSEALNHLPVAVPAPAGRSLASLSDDEVQQLLGEVGPSPWLGFLGVPLLILGIVATSVGAGTLALWLCVQLGLGSLPTAVAMVGAVLTAIPAYNAGAVSLTRGAARLSAHQRAEVAVDALALAPDAAEELKAWLTGRGPRPSAMRRCLAPPGRCSAARTDARAEAAPSPHVEHA